MKLFRLHKFGDEKAQSKYFFDVFIQSHHMTRGPLNGISRGPMNKMQTTPVWWATFMLYVDDDDFDDVNDIYVGNADDE